MQRSYFDLRSLLLTAAFCVTAVLLFQIPLLGSPPDKKKAMETKIQAAFLYHFTHYVEWPAAAFKKKDSPIEIGIVGKDPYGKLIDQAVSGKKVKGRKIVVRRFPQIKNLKPCHILFIPPTEMKQLRAVLKRLAGTWTLTVGNAKGFIEQGGMINFVKKEDSVRFEVGVDRARKSRLKISSKLLKVALKVIREKEEKK